ncbi:MAG TPA: CPBP family intramembrane glutamic endopeptidase [Rhizomicrobium sp.]|jgi:hypothetical protein|nr:CPBP family intramembrane glutamic endopeptidase [Rhizomicrobium sp.]
MLDRRAARIVWGSLLGVILLEGWALVASFGGPHAMQRLARYLLTMPGTLPAWVLAAAVTVLYAGYAARASAFIGAHMLRPSNWRPFIGLRLVAVLAALVSGFFEEAFFRKMLMDLAMQHGAAIAVQVAVSALAFGAAHAVWGLFGGSLRAAAGAMLATGVLGLALAAIYVVGGRAVLPCIVAHAAINLLLEPWLIIAAATGRWGRLEAKAPAAPGSRPA